MSSSEETMSPGRDEAMSLRSFRTDSEAGYPCLPNQGNPASTCPRLVRLSEHLLPNQDAPEPKRRCNRPGKDVRAKASMKEMKSMIEKLTKDRIANIEARWQCSLEKALEKGVVTMSVKDKNLEGNFTAILFSNSPGEKEALDLICNRTKDVYSRIRHGGPWSDVPGLLDKKCEVYLHGSQSFLRADWGYTPNAPNLTLAWVIFTDDGEVVGRGGLQPEDGVNPPMTEPFVALMPSFWNRGIATAFFRQCLVPFYNKHSGMAPMRILTLPVNTAAQKIANNTELMRRKFTFKGYVDEWDQKYEIYESIIPDSCGSAEMD